MSSTENRVTLPTYLIIFALLMVLLGATVFVAQVKMDPKLSLLVALAIAITKALLIVLYFMGVRYSSQRVWLASGAGFFWLIIMISILDDYITRH